MPTTGTLNVLTQNLEMNLQEITWDTATENCNANFRSFHMTVSYNTRHAQIKESKRKAKNRSKLWVTKGMRKSIKDLSVTQK